MNKELIANIEKYLLDNDLFEGTPSDDEEINKAEKELNVSFDEDYREFLKLFGGSYVGFPVYGFKNCEMLSSETVTDLTDSFRKSFRVDQRFPIVQESYVISMDGNGDPIIIDKEGKVRIFYHDNNEVKTLANTFEELIERYLPN